MLEQLLAEVPSGVERADVLLALALDVHGRLSDADRALRRGSRRGGRRRRALGADPGLRSLDPLVEGRRTRGARSTPERRWRGPSGSAIPRCIAVAIARLGQAETWAAESHARLARAGRGDRGAPRALPRVLRRARACSLARLLMRLGEIERARAMLRGAGERRRWREATRARACLILWSLSDARVARRPLAAGARPRRRGPRARRADAASAHARLGGPGQGARRGGPRPRRAGARLGRGRPRVRAGDLERDLRRPHASACSADSSSRSATWRLPATTCASCPGGCSPAG